MKTIGEAFSYPFRDPQWPSKLLVQGLITLIPIVGWIATVGWMLKTAENLRQGRQELAPYGFHLGRGWQLIVPQIVWGLVVGIPIWLVIAVLGAVGTQTDTNTGFTTLNPLAALVIFLLYLVLIVFWLLVGPSLSVNVLRGGMAGGFNPGQIVAIISRDFGTTIVVGLLYLVAGLIAGVGSLACGIGVIFTIPFAVAIQSGLVAWLDMQSSRPQPAYPGGGYPPAAGYQPPPASGPYTPPSQAPQWGPTPPPPPAGGSYPPPPPQGPPPPPAPPQGPPPPPAPPQGPPSPPPGGYPPPPPPPPPGPPDAAS